MSGLGLKSGLEKRIWCGSCGVGVGRCIGERRRVGRKERYCTAVSKLKISCVGIRVDGALLVFKVAVGAS